MAVIWNKTKFLGVRYREHKIRKHGGNRPDKCFSIRYKLDGRDKEESIGWSSEGVSAESAFKILSQIRENIRTGNGPCTFAEMRLAKQQEKKARIENEAKEAHAGFTFSQFWKEHYFPEVLSTKSQGSIESELGMFNKWISPILSDCPLSSLTVAHIETIVKNARNANRSAATLRYIITVISQIWNMARRLEIVDGECPCRKIKKPREDNRRIRFLSIEESKMLLDELALHSLDMRDIALISLQTGLRAGEIHGLTWGNIDFENKTIEVLDTKTKRNRYAFLTPELEAMFRARYSGANLDMLIFPAKNGKRRRWVSTTFDRVVNKLGFNDTGEYSINAAGEKEPIKIKDARKKVVFHTLRHTFASWLVQDGTPLYTVAELMGHTTLEMTRRYSHLAPDSLRNVAMRISDIMQTKNNNEKEIAV